MHLTLQSLTWNLIQQSFSYFPKSYLERLKHKQEESIVARFLISKLVEEKYWIKDFLPKVDENWVPVFEKDIFWSISHKKGVVFVAVKGWQKINQKIFRRYIKIEEWVGVDLEIIKERDIILLDTFKNSEYKLLWGKNWKNFYRLWTGKEAIIKYNLWKLDDMKDLILESVEEVSIEIDWMKFDKKLIISWKVVYSCLKEDKVLSITIWNEHLLVF